MTGESIYDTFRCSHFRREHSASYGLHTTCLDVDDGEFPCPTWTLARKAS